MRLVAIITICLVAGVAQARTRMAAWGLVVRGGAAEKDAYVTQLEAVQAQVFQAQSTAVDELRQTIVDQGRVVPDLGHQADLICNQALQDFTSAAPAVDDNDSNSAMHASAYDRCLAALTAALDAPLHVLYLKQLATLRQTALTQYRKATAGEGRGGASYEAMLQADAAFCAAAEASTRPGSDWEYAAERSFLQTVLNSMAESGRQAMTVQMKSAKQQQTAMQFLQSQQQMIQQLQMQLYGQQSPWNVGVAYRIPDTNFNLQGSYQQGKTNLQLSCVPDEYAPFLGPNGFTNGVGPGNLGLSLNLSV